MFKFCRVVCATLFSFFAYPVLGQISNLSIEFSIDSIKNNSLVALSAPENDYLLTLRLEKKAKRKMIIGLELRVEGDSLKVRSEEAFMKKILLKPADSIIFETDAIRHYFNPDSLVFDGNISKKDYLNNNTLPEGYYSVCFRAFEWNNRANVLDSTCIVCKKVYLTKMKNFGKLVKIKERTDSITLKHFIQDFFLPLIDKTGLTYEEAVDFLDKYELLLNVARETGFPDDYIKERFGLSEKILKEARDCIERENKKLLPKKNSDSLGYLTNSNYDTIIFCKNRKINARSIKGIGYWGERIKNTNDRIESYLSKINPNKESLFIKNSSGEYIAFDNLVSDTLQVGKLILSENSSWYYVYDRHRFFRQKVLYEAILQLETAKTKNLKLEWLVSDKKAVEQLKRFFLQKNLNVTVSLLTE